MPRAAKIKVLDPVPPRRPIGGVSHVPTPKDRNMVLSMVGYGIPFVEIANVLRITDDTLRKHYREELARGKTVANLQVIQNLHKIAKGTGREAVTAAMFWLRCQAGWSEYKAQAPVDALDNVRPGKKELADIQAQTAEIGTRWSDLLH